jgi:hypothetical protein
MAFFDIRRARVRARYAYLYPPLTPGVWYSAKNAARVVYRAITREHIPVPLEGRVLSDRHFEFRGGRRGGQYLTGMWTPRTGRVVALALITASAAGLSYSADRS